MALALSDAQSLAWLDWAQSDPVGWVRTILGEEPWQKQRWIMEAVRDHQRVAIKSCHSSGKSWCVSRLATWFIASHPFSLVVTTAPTHRQVEKIIWPEIRRAKRNAEKRGVNLPGRVLTTDWKIDDKWEAMGFSTDDSDRFQGLHSDYMLVIVDEASGIAPDIWNAIEGILASGRKVRLVTIGNPTDPTGPWAKEFASLPSTAKFSISAFDTPNFTKFGITPDDIIGDTWRAKMSGLPVPIPMLVSPEWVADKVKRWGVHSPMWKSRVLGEFPDSAPDALIPLSWIEAAHRRFANEQYDGTVAVELGVDVARQGDDETIIVVRRGVVAKVVSQSHQEDTVATTGRVMQAWRDTRATQIKVDGVGIGAGVVDNLRDSKAPVHDMQAAKGAREHELFINARAEWYWTLRERFERTYLDPTSSDGIAIDPLDDDLTAQLANMKYKIDRSGRTQIESKEDMKKRGLPSPDRADALMLAYASPGLVLPHSFDLYTVGQAPYFKIGE